MASSHVTVVGSERVQSALFSFSPALVERLKAVLRSSAERIASRERASLGGHSKTGAQAGTVKVTVKSFKDRWVGASVRVGGGKRVPYARVFERGIDAVVQVPEHQRNGFSVRAHEMKFKRPSHEYLAKALQSEAATVSSEVSQAIDGTVSAEGLR